jgi:hypothetical protein
MQALDLVLAFQMADEQRGQAQTAGRVMGALVMSMILAGVVWGVLYAIADRRRDARTMKPPRSDGWYPDPMDAGRNRWVEKGGWTQHVADKTGARGVDPVKVRPGFPIGPSGWHPILLTVGAAWSVLVLLNALRVIANT